MPSRCRHCQRPTLWMINHQGHLAAFDTDPLPARYDGDQAGWAPGLFPIAGKLRRCMAPITAFTPERQETIANVLTVHHCQDSA